MEENLDKKLTEGDPELEEDELEQDTEEKMKQRNHDLIEAAKEGDVSKARKLLDRGANIFHEDKKKWNSLIWATCKGHIDMVRFLLSRGAGEPYRVKTALNATTLLSNTGSIDIGFDNTATLKQTLSNSPDKKASQSNSNEQGNARGTPLSWACFKGFHQILCLLLKDGQDLSEADGLGNNAIHQAAAGGFEQIMHILLQYGIKLDDKNKRVHSVFDLCTNPNILSYLNQYQNTKECQKCKRVFTPGQIKYLCSICDKFMCKNCCQQLWLYETKESQEKEKLECRCITCSEDVQRKQEILQELMATYNLVGLTEMLEMIEQKDIHIEAKLLEKARVHEEKLKTQKTIIDYIATLKEVENYKTIKKSINTVHAMVEDARKRNVNLDVNILEKIDSEVARLEAERNLRFELDNLQISTAKPEEVKMLEDLKYIAKERGVALKYGEEADELSIKMNKNIDARNILKNFIEYPRRDFYPPPYYLDMKTKKYMDAVTRKPIDPKLLQPPPAKKGKKASKWAIPEWATDTIKLGQQIKQLEEYLVNAKELDLDEEFIKKAQEEFAYIKKEFKYRKQVEDEAKFFASDPKNQKKPTK